MKHMRGLLGFMALALAVGGCSSGTLTAKGILGSYDVMISAMGKSDPDIMTITEGRSGTILFTFNVGITTDPMGPNPDGLRGTLNGGNMIQIPAQPAHIDHSTGQLDGSLTADGMVAPDGSSLMMTIHFTPTNFAIPQDGGAPGSDGGVGPTLDYVVTGMLEM